MTNTDAGAGSGSGQGTGAGAGGNAGGAGANGAGAGDAAPWYSGADSETVGWLQSKGWDKDPKTAALGAIKSYRAVESYIHAPPDQLVRWPKDASDAANWAKVHERLGVPAKAEDYDLSSVKFADGSALDDAFVAAMREGLKEAAVPKDRASSIVQRVVKFMDSAEDAEGAQYQSKLQAERDALKLNWGNNADYNYQLARAAFNRLVGSRGWTEERIQTAFANIEKQLGYADTMEIFRDIGKRTGEDKYIGGGINNNGPLTKDMAQAELNSKMADHAWTQRLLAKDATAVLEFNNLTSIINARSMG